MSLQQIDVTEAALPPEGGAPSTVGFRQQGRDEALTERERQILRLLSVGASNREIARQLYRSENTIKYHLKNIFAKLGVNSRTRAVILLQTTAPVQRLVRQQSL